MAEAQPKRLREEEEEEEVESRQDSSSESDDSSSNPSKRHKPYNNILHLLDEEEEELGEPAAEQGHELSRDLSAIFSTLEQELSSNSSGDSTVLAPSVEEATGTTHVPAEGDASAGGEVEVEHDQGSVKSVMRHLLEASDDELGIPTTRDEYDRLNGGVEVSDSAGDFPVGFADHGLWELEDEAANYYTVLQSELFM